jgi:tyrosyl-tRNA synthetase
MYCLRYKLPHLSHHIRHRPLQVDSEGRKFGKSTGGAIWLSAAKLSPYKFYQYLFATTDADVVKFLRMLTFLPLEEVAAVEAAMAAPEYRPNTAQRRLAEEVTRCGEAAACCMAAWLLCMCALVHPGCG